MSENTKGARAAGWLAFILAVLGGTAVVVTRDKEPETTEPVTETTETRAPEVAVEPTVTNPPEPETTTVEEARPRPVPHPGCSEEARALSSRYAKESGYGYLVERCDLIAQWLADGGEVTEWLAARGHDSPAADCRYQVSWTLPSEEKVYTGFEITDVKTGMSVDVTFPYDENRREFSSDVSLPCWTDPTHIVTGTGWVTEKQVP